MTKEEILAEMKEKYELSNDQAREYLKPIDVRKTDKDSCDLDSDCLTCGS